MRTNGLVALGSALFVTVSVLSDDPNPTRVAAQVASGIGFLCAGVIMRQGLSVIGLNTAATLWCSSGVGVLAGMGHFAPAAMGAATVIFANLVFRTISRKMDQRQSESPSGYVKYLLRIACPASRLTDVRQHVVGEVSNSELRLRALHSEPSEPGMMEVRADLDSIGRADEALEQIVAKLGVASEIVGVRWEIASNEEGPSPMGNGGRRLI